VFQTPWLCSVDTLELGCLTSTPTVTINHVYNVSGLKASGGGNAKAFRAFDTHRNLRSFTGGRPKAACPFRGVVERKTCAFLSRMVPFRVGMFEGEARRK